MAVRHANDDNAVAAGSAGVLVAVVVAVLVAVLVADLAGANWDECRAEIGFQHVHELNCLGKATEGEILWLAPCLLSVIVDLSDKLSNVNSDWNLICCLFVIGCSDCVWSTVVVVVIVIVV